jgi:hypothetical protein
MSTEKEPQEKKPLTEQAGETAAAPAEQSEKVGAKEQARRGWRKTGYVWAIVVNVILLYVFNNLLNWELSSRWVTARFADTLWAINLSISAAIVANALFLYYDPSWFRHLLQVVLNVLAFNGLYTVYKAFPFNLELPWSEWPIKIALLAAMLGTGIAAVVEFAQLFAKRDEQ